MKTPHPPGTPGEPPPTRRGCPSIVSARARARGRGHDIHESRLADDPHPSAIPIRVVLVVVVVVA